jgi:hypothetical protein
MRSEAGPRVLRVCGAATLVVFVSLAGLCCGGEARPEGLVAFSHGVGDDVFVISLPEGDVRR